MQAARLPKRRVAHNKNTPLHRLRLALPAGFDPDHPVFDWVATAADGRVLERGQGDPGRYRQSRLIELLLPAPMALSVNITLPTASRKQAFKVAAFALEDRLLASPEQCHIALGGSRDKLFPAVVVARPWLKLLLSTLGKLGIKLGAAYSSAALLPVERGVWHAAMEEGRGYVRVNDSEGFSFDATSASLPVEIGLALARAAESPSRLVLHGADAALIAGWQADGLEIVDAPALDWGAAAVSGDAINLLQGEFATSATLDVDWKRLKPTLWLAGIALAIYMGSVVADWASLGYKRKQLDQQMTAELRKIMPNGPILNPLLQAQRIAQSRSAQSGGGLPPDGLLGRLQALAPLLGEVSLNGIDFRGSTLTLDCKFPNPAAADSLLQRLNGAGMAAKLDGLPGNGGQSGKIIVAGRK